MIDGECDRLVSARSHRTRANGALTSMLLLPDVIFDGPHAVHGSLRSLSS
jgi:hypothetical protein